MASVSVTVNGRRYEIACDDGQEAHLTRLSRYIDQRVGELVAAVGQIGEARLLLMASLLVADELSDAYQEIRASGAGEKRAQAERALEEELSGTLEQMAERIEGIAQKLERL